MVRHGGYLERTVLSPVKSGNIWRALIAWPNGSESYFGKFASEKDAVNWIAAHPHLTKPFRSSAADWRKIIIDRPGPREVGD
jgi:hypothetical protein